ncbi:GNAT family N-acetyltransferase [Paenibacillus sp. J31TS4]|uniref:GNAT family N-acetyltransferase n=1 Tax=Paenibacillus sp. J31TS4 TaxID=2807195 RepID=UPI001BCF5A74|nr:GNAT family N-acetyltransferase [Paenibacillus sp. J31TS4]
MNIRRRTEGERPPMELLLLADPSEPLVLEYLERGMCYLAESEDGVTVGVYVLLPTRPETVELVNVAVAEPLHGRGIGKRLVQHAVRTAAEAGFRTIEVGTGSTGVAQLALYQKCGFRMTGIDRDFFVRHYAEPIYENGMRLRDMVRLSQDL